MTRLRQLSLLPPQQEAEITRYTTLGATLPLFQQHLQRAGRSLYTLRAFASDLRLLARYTNDDLPVGAFTPERLNEFLGWLEHGRGLPCSRKSWARRVTTLKVYFRWLHGLKVIASDPAAGIAQRSGPAPLARVLAPDEVARALAAARRAGQQTRPDARPELLLRLLLETGIKKGETVRLRREDFDRDCEPPLLTVRYRLRGARAQQDPEQQPRNPWRERRIALQPDLLPLLDVWLAQQDAGGTRVFDCGAGNLEYVLARLAAEAALERLSFEMLRWTSALRDWQAGMAPAALRDKLGLSASSWLQTRAKLEQLARAGAEQPRPGEAQRPASRD